MKLRIASAVLWFLAGWFAVGSIGVHVGLNPAVGLLVGLAWATFIVLDPRDLIWRVGQRSAGVARDVGANQAAGRSQVGAP
jgi:hypothetical protein